jgi:hypothetical protein
VAQPNRLLNAFRERLIGDAAFNAYVAFMRENGAVALDGSGNPVPDPLGARIEARDGIDVEEPRYPFVTLWNERSRRAIFAPGTYDPAFVRVQFYSQNDQSEAMAMRELATLLLHDQKTLLSTGELCVHGVFEVDGQDPVYVERTGAWMGWSLYKVRATLLT